VVGVGDTGDEDEGEGSERYEGGEGFSQEGLFDRLMAVRSAPLRSSHSSGGVRTEM
jgi:hypothetical protein